MISIVLSLHAFDMLHERDIERAWVERAVEQPDAMEPEPVHGGRMRASRAVPERDGRILRVVYTPDEQDIRVITRFLDRSRRKSDRETDALFMRFADTPIAETEEVRPGIMLDVDASGRIVAIEVADASVHLANGADLGKFAAA